MTSPLRQNSKPIKEDLHRTLHSQNPIQSNLNPEAKPFQPQEREPGLVKKATLEEPKSNRVVINPPVSPPVNLQALQTLDGEPVTVTLTASEQISLLTMKRASVVKMHPFLQTRADLRPSNSLKSQAITSMASSGIPLNQAQELLGMVSPKVPLIYQDQVDPIVLVIQSLNDRPKDLWEDPLELLDRLDIKTYLKPKWQQMIQGCMSLISLKSDPEVHKQMFPEELFKAHQHYHQFWKAEIQVEEFQIAMNSKDHLSATKMLFSLTEARLVSLSEAMEELMMACDAKFKRIMAISSNCSQTAEMDFIVLTLKELTKNLCIYAQELSSIQMAQSANAMTLHMPQEITRVASEMERHFGTQLGQRRVSIPWNYRDIMAIRCLSTRMIALDSFLRDNSRKDWRLRKGHSSLPLLWNREPFLPNLSLIHPVWIPEGENLKGLKESQEEAKEALYIDSIMDETLRGKLPELSAEDVIQALDIQRPRPEAKETTTNVTTAMEMNAMEGQVQWPRPRPLPRLHPLFMALMLMFAILSNVLVDAQNTPQNTQADKRDVAEISKQNGVLNTKLSVHAENWAMFRSIQLTVSGISMGILLTFAIVMTAIWCSRVWTKTSPLPYHQTNQLPLQGLGTNMGVQYHPNTFSDLTYAVPPRRLSNNYNAGDSYAGRMDQQPSGMRPNEDRGQREGGPNEATRNPVTGSPKPSRN